MSSTNMNPTTPTILLFHKFVEKTIREIGYGTITFNFILKKGEVCSETVSLVRQRRKKYKAKPLTGNQ